MDTPRPLSPAPVHALPRDPALLALWAQAALANPYGVAILDADGNTIVAVNEAGARLLLMEPAAIVGRSALEFYAPEDRERLAAWFRRSDDGIHAHFEASFVRADGATVPAELTVHAVRDADGRVTHHVAAVRDITARRAAQRESRDYQQRLRALAQQLEQAREADRHAIGVTLHEGLMQSLTALGLGLERLKLGLAHRGGEDGALLRIAERLQSNIRDMTARMRASVAELRPAGLDHLGLWPALENYVETWSQLAGVPVHLDLLARPTIATPVALGAFRAVQEALANVARHSCATRVELTTRAVPAEWTSSSRTTASASVATISTSRVRSACSR